jgi:hypothetical protein
LTRLIEFSLEDGGSIMVEMAEPVSPDGVLRAGRRDQLADKASDTFEAALEKVKPAASSMIAKLRSLPDAPEEIEVEFGLKLSAEAGAIVASVSGEAHYKVTLKWHQR